MLIGLGEQKRRRLQKIEALKVRLTEIKAEIRKTEWEIKRINEQLTERRNHVLISKTNKE